ncbi:MAG: alpha/beta fold hydrolase [Verrucomicrobiota bacterium]|jgi:pimeloyl-ACP methyl ester carboxylesterase|nr:alpha/beta fold hydrolase [Verrucomicrobiota bacterium]
MKQTNECGEWSVDGSLVALPADGPRGKARFLDGFFRPAPEAISPLLVFVHGMGSNFYRSALKKAFLDVAPAMGVSILSFNNRGAERGTEDERFETCLLDLDAVMSFARRHGYRQIVLIGHSTGCQKATFWQAKRQRREVKGVVLLAPTDDQATVQRDLGRRFEQKVAWAREQVALGKGDRLVAGLYERFTAARFLSVADPRRTEASLFRYAGPLTHFRRVRCPVLAIFGEKEEFAAIPPAQMLGILRRKTRSVDYDDWLIPATGHSFKGCEQELALVVCDWIREITS